jgi:hypothetical protein
MIFFSLLYYFIHYFYSGLNFESSNTKLYLKKIQTNNYDYGMKKNDSQELLDKYFENPSEVSLTFKSENNKNEGYDERYPIPKLKTYLFNSIYNSSLSSNFTSQDTTLQLYNENVSYEINLEEYKNLLKIKLFFLKQKFLSYLISPKVSILTKTTLVEKYYKNNDIFNQKVQNADLFKDFEM